MGRTEPLLLDSSLQRLQQADCRSTRWTSSLLVLMLVLPCLAHAQFMRIGPFDLDVNTALQFIYTTNVDGNRKSEAVLEREDYYLVWSLGAQLGGPTTPTAELTLDTAISVEKHFVRDDLDNASDPFGNLSLTHDMELGRFQLPTAIILRRENTQDDDGTIRIFIPGQRQERIVQDTRSINQGVNWSREPFSFNSSFSYSQTRYPDPEFRDGDEDSYAAGFGLTWDMFRWGGDRRLSSFYNYSQDKTDLLNRPEGAGSGEWSRSQSLGLSLQVLTRPNLTYSFGYSKDGNADWRYTHNASISDLWELSPTVIINASASYTIDEQPQDDDIAFTYSGSIEHQIGETLRHSLRVSRQPVDTFGSTSDTDSTSIGYALSKSDLFFANLTFNFGVNHEINKPQGPEAGPTEESTTYTVGLSHSAALSRRLSRTFGYVYSYETNKQESEPIDEHRVTLGLSFTF